jgi:pectinesterase
VKVSLLKSSPFKTPSDRLSTKPLPSLYKLKMLHSTDANFYRCKFSGYQDTIYYNSGQQFYRECIIEGTIDFIFGYGNAVFQKCLILVKQPMANQVNIITVEGRKTKRTNTCLKIQSCTMGATADISWLKSSMHSTFLGRPWREYCTTFIHCYLGRIIHPEGLLAWAVRPVII